MSAYIQETATTWCETTDSDMHFSVRSVHDMMGSKPFVAAAMSLASRQRDAVQGRRRHLTLELYQYTIRLLLGQDPTKPDASILATCTILCAYEMMASSVSEWRRHLRGCAELLRMCKWNGNSEGIVKSCFWAFARIDVWAAFILNQTTLIPTDSWVNQDSLVLVAAAGETDDYCNLAILIFARIINVLNDKGGARRQSQTKLRDNVQNLWDELQLWRRWRLPSVKPLMRIDQSDKSPFPTIMFALSSSICGNTFYHAGSILLLQSGLVNPDPSPEMAKALSPHWHAGELGGISISNPSHANWVNHLQPLYIAGTALDAVPKKALSGQWRPVDAGTAEEADDPTDMDFAAEKVALLRHLAKIERETGWKTKERARDLRVLWGLEN
uniref:Transcription factor domain-containing protein n=1 Tax=Bionectria ochroleuca TaxID=29856 RepID=A0A8H7K7F1_BIOOC